MTAGPRAASDAILAAVVRASLDGVIVADAEGRVLELDPAAEAAFGRRRAAVLGRPIGELIAPPPPHDARGAAGMGRFLAGGAPRATGRRIEARATRADGSTFPVELAITELPADGRRLFAVGLRDLSEQHAREEALRASETFLRDLLDDQTDLVFRYDRALRIVFCNEVTSRVFGIPREAQLGTPMSRWMLPEVWARLEPELRGLTPAAPPLHATDPKAMPNGEVRWFEWTNRAIFDDGGRIAGYQSVGRDITERRLADLALAESEARFEAAAEGLIDGLAIFDAEDRLAYHNSRYPEHLPPTLRATLALGNRWPDWLAQAERLGPVYHPDMGEGFAALRQLEQRQPSCDREFRLTDGRWLRVREGRMPDGGRVQLSADVTARREAEAALRASEARFLAAAESIPDGMVIFDAEDRIAFYNSRHPEHLPASLREALRPGIRFEDWIREGEARGPVYHPDMGGDYAERRLASRRQERLEHEHKHADGRWVRVREARMPGGGRVLLTTDVTESRRQRRALARKTRQLEAVLAGIAEGVSIIDRHGRVVLVNEGFLRLYGFPAGLAAPGTPLAAFVEHRLRAGRLRPEERDGAPLEALVERRVRELLAFRGVSTFEEETPDGRVVLVRRERLEGDGLIVSTYEDVTERRRAEAALKVSEELLRATVDDLTELVCQFDADFKLVFSNKAHARLFGRTPEQLVGLDLFDGVIERARERVRAEILALTPERPVCEGLNEKATPGGAVRWFAWVNRALFDASGRRVGVQAVGRDVTEQHLAEVALRASEARFAAFMEHAPIGMYLKDLDGRYAMLNPEMEKVLGRPAETMLGRRPAEVFGEREAAMIRAYDREIVERGLPTRQEEHLPGRDAYAWSMVIRFPVRDASGRIVQIGGFDVDITAMKRALAELEASEQRFRAIALSHPTPMMVARLADKKAMFANEALHATFRLAAGEFPTYDRDRFYADPAERAAMFAEVGARGRVDDREVAMRRADGEPFPAFLTARAIAYEGDACAVVSFQDLSALKAAEGELTRSREALHQSEKLRAMGSLLAGVAHELNNPLAILVGQASMLEEEAGRGVLARRAAMIRAAAERCAKIVQTFVAMARRKPPERRATDLNEVARAALEIASYGLRTAGVAVRTDLAPGLPPLEADADQLHQVVLNLLINAQQALEATPPPRTLAVRTARAGPGALVLEVADNGPGVPAEIRPRIFEPFFTTKPPGAGMGVGLSFSHGIAEAHHGRLELVDAAGEGGAIFRLTLPIGAPHAAPSAEPPRAGSAAARLTALIVDDEPEVAATLAEILAGDGHAVEVVLSGEAARRLLAERDVDIVLCDLRMPGLDGPALFDWLRRTRPDLAARTAFVTGDALGAGAASFLARSGRPALEKPFTRDAVRRIIATLGADGSA